MHRRCRRCRKWRYHRWRGWCARTSRLGARAPRYARVQRCHRQRSPCHASHCCCHNCGHSHPRWRFLRRRGWRRGPWRRRPGRERIQSASVWHAWRSTPLMHRPVTDRPRNGLGMPVPRLGGRKSGAAPARIWRMIFTNPQEGTSGRGPGAFSRCPAARAACASQSCRHPLPRRVAHVPIEAFRDAHQTAGGC